MNSILNSVSIYSSLLAVAAASAALALAALDASLVAVFVDSRTVRQLGDLRIGSVVVDKFLQTERVLDSVVPLAHVDGEILGDLAAGDLSCSAEHNSVLSVYIESSARTCLSDLEPHEPLTDILDLSRSVDSEHILNASLANAERCDVIYNALRIVAKENCVPDPSRHAAASEKTASHTDRVAVVFAFAADSLAGASHVGQRPAVCCVQDLI